MTGKRRGSTVEDAQQPAKAGSWDFHDWYVLLGPGLAADIGVLHQIG